MAFFIFVGTKIFSIGKLSDVGITRLRFYRARRNPCRWCWEFRREGFDGKGNFGGRVLMSIEAGTNLR
jgi:hypothetical protein